MDIISKLQTYRPILWVVSLTGLLGINGIFVYYAAFHPDVVAAALENPVSLVFIVEAFVMVAFASGVIWRLQLERPGWIWFIIMSLVGGLAFSIPFFILLHLRKRQDRPGSTGYS